MTTYDGVRAFAHLQAVPDTNIDEETPGFGKVQDFLERFGYLTIPTMALTAFALIATLLLLAPKETDG